MRSVNAVPFWVLAGAAMALTAGDVPMKPLGILSDELALCRLSFKAKTRVYALIGSH